MSDHGISRKKFIAGLGLGVPTAAITLGAGARFARAQSTAGLVTNLVADHQAVGDGTTDDTLAFKSAAATGQHIYVPPGVYLISDTIKLSKPSQNLFSDFAAVSDGSDWNASDDVSLSDASWSATLVWTSSTDDVGAIVRCAAHKNGIEGIRFDGPRLPPESRRLV